MQEELLTQAEEEEIESIESHSQAVEVVSWLRAEISGLLETVKAQEVWQAVTAPDADPKFVRTMMGEIYADIVGYQPHVIEAAICSISQFPRSVPTRLVKAMLVHQGDEFDHGEMAFRDAVGLGIIPDSLKRRPLSPEAFAVSGVWWMIVQMRNPFMYLGALYLFEGLTPTVTGAIKGALRNKGFNNDSLEYIEFHSTEDIKHAALIDNTIGRIAEMYPAEIPSIKRGFAYFRNVYPLPLWNAAYTRAREAFD